MNDQANVHILVGGKPPQITHHSVLEIKLLNSLGLSAEHELQIVDANQLHVMSVDRVLQTLHHFAYIRRPVEIQKVERVLLEFFKALEEKVWINHV